MSIAADESVQQPSVAKQPRMEEVVVTGRQEPESPLKRGDVTVEFVPSAADSGVGSQAIINTAVDKMKKDVFSSWDNASPRERLNSLQRVINDASAAIGMPAPRIFPADTGRAAGEFSLDGWALNVNKSIIFDNSTCLSPDAERNIADVMLHELRHGEQYYDIARLRLTGGDSTSALRELNYPERVLSAAATNPLSADSSVGHQASVMYDSYFGVGSAARNATLQNLRSTPTTSPNFKTTYEQYLMLPEERDAWSVGAKVQKTWNGK